jgi:hypothetical protein
MSRRKLSKADYKAFNRATPVGVRYPPGGGRTEMRVATTKPKLRRKRNNEGG